MALILPSNREVKLKVIKICDSVTGRVQVAVLEVKPDSKIKGWCLVLCKRSIFELRGCFTFRDEITSSSAIDSRLLMPCDKNSFCYLICFVVLISCLSLQYIYLFSNIF